MSAVRASVVTAARRSLRSGLAMRDRSRAPLLGLLAICLALILAPPCPAQPATADESLWGEWLGDAPVSLQIRLTAGGQSADSSGAEFEVVDGRRFFAVTFAGTALDTLRATGSSQATLAALVDGSLGTDSLEVELASLPVVVHLDAGAPALPEVTLVAADGAVSIGASSRLTLTAVVASAASETLSGKLRWIADGGAFELESPVQLDASSTLVSRIATDVDDADALPQVWELWWWPDSDRAPAALRRFELHEGATFLSDGLAGGGKLSSLEPKSVVSGEVIAAGPVSLPLGAYLSVHLQTSAAVAETLRDDLAVWSFEASVPSTSADSSSTTDSTTAGFSLSLETAEVQSLPEGGAWVRQLWQSHGAGPLTDFTLSGPDDSPLSGSWILRSLELFYPHEPSTSY